jgi:hypothetical protein
MTAVKSNTDGHMRQQEPVAIRLLQRGCYKTQKLRQSWDNEADHVVSCGHKSNQYLRYSTHFHFITANDPLHITFLNGFDGVELTDYEHSF